jgi:hypothetical protein
MKHDAEAPLLASPAPCGTVHAREKCGHLGSYPATLNNFIIDGKHMRSKMVGK